MVALDETNIKLANVFHHTVQEEDHLAFYMYMALCGPKYKILVLTCIVSAQKPRLKSHTDVYSGVQDSGTYRICSKASLKSSY